MLCFKNVFSKDKIPIQSQPVVALLQGRELQRLVSSCSSSSTFKLQSVNFVGANRQGNETFVLKGFWLEGIRIPNYT